MKTTKSQKGKWGHVGAPPKNVRYPRRKFTVASAVALNEGVCELTIRNRIKADLKAGKLVELDVVKQPKKAVGRPQFSFILKELAGKAKAPKAPKTAKTVKVKTPKATKPASVPVVAVAPAVPATPIVPTPASVTTPAAPAPADETPATEVTPATLP